MNTPKLRGLPEGWTATRITDPEDMGREMLFATHEKNSESDDCYVKALDMNITLTPHRDLLDDTYVWELTPPDVDAKAEDVSDGYHTFKELYEHRAMLFLALMRCHSPDAWFSLKHRDHTAMFADMFVAGINLPSGQVTYHLGMEHWDTAVSTGSEELDVAPEWDGHDAKQVCERLGKFARDTTEMEELCELIARAAHEGQTRRDGVTPYITHVEAVVSRCVGPEQRAVAWLHDVIEDTEIGTEYLHDMGVSTAIADYVFTLTHHKGEAYAKYIERVCMSPVTAAVKKADMLSNLADKPTDKQVVKYAAALLTLSKTWGL